MSGAAVLPGEQVQMLGHHDRACLPGDMQHHASQACVGLCSACGASAADWVPECGPPHA